ncbi:hypothetical protein GGQ21_003234 [Salinibacter ruber]|uniref:Uncharacterized protein n=1 Tax=Salinibacter ruber TaxID=146919 RepID=A0A9X2V8M2_9BACT|nr:hypothetical protein [Salinibacter ruber]MCS4123128.1 hypothetical protein [Salinibacter ruber]
MGALAHRRRALPVCWQVRRRTGAGDAEQQRGPPQALYKRINDARDAEDPCDDVPEVIVIGDGAFHSTDLMSYSIE